MIKPVESVKDDNFNEFYEWATKKVSICRVRRKNVPPEFIHYFDKFIKRASDIAGEDGSLDALNAIEVSNVFNFIKPLQTIEKKATVQDVEALVSFWHLAM